MNKPDYKTILDIKHEHAGKLHFMTAIYFAAWRNPEHLKKIRRQKVLIIQ